MPPGRSRPAPPSFLGECVMSDHANLMAGKTVLMTGSTGGIGRATAEGLARLGARVGVTGRCITRTQAAAAETAKVTASPGGLRIRRGPVRAGRGTPPRPRGARRVPATGYAGQQRGRILGDPAPDRRWAGAHRRAQPPRSVPAHQPAAGPAHRLRRRPHRHGLLRPQALGKIDFGDLQGERAYSGQRAYHQSKLANVMFTTPIYLASSPDVEGVTGRYFANRRPKKSSKSSCDTRRGGPALGAQRRPGRPARHDLTPA